LGRYLLAQSGLIAVIRGSGHASFDTSAPQRGTKAGAPASSLLLAEIEFPIIISLQHTMSYAKISEITKY